MHAYMYFPNKLSITLLITVDQFSTEVSAPSPKSTHPLLLRTRTACTHGRSHVPNKPPTLTPKGVEQSREARVSEAGGEGDGASHRSQRGGEEGPSSLPPRSPSGLIRARGRLICRFCDDPSEALKGEITRHARNALDNRTNHCEKTRIALFVPLVVASNHENALDPHGFEQILNESRMIGLHN